MNTRWRTATGLTTGAERSLGMKHGDFTALADSYARYRPGYAPFVLEAFLSLGERERERERDFVLT